MNGNSTDKKLSSFELEPAIQQQQPSQVLTFFQSLWALIVAYACYYRGITATILAATFILLMVVSMDALVSHVASQKFHHLTQDYSTIPSLYQLKMAQIDHWCLQVSNTLTIMFL